jgi:hypothetical protein
MVVKFTYTNLLLYGQVCNKNYLCNKAWRCVIGEPVQAKKARVASRLQPNADTRARTEKMAHAVIGSNNFLISLLLIIMY